MEPAYTVKVTRQAQAQLQDITRYVAFRLQNPIAAHRLLDTLEQSIASLKLLPHRIVLTEEEPWHSYGIHKMSVKNYLVYFWIDENAQTVHVIAVILARRDQRAALEQSTQEIVDHT